MIARLAKKPEAGGMRLVVREVIAPPQAVHFAHQTVDMAKLAGVIRMRSSAGEPMKALRFSSAEGCTTSTRNL